MGSEEVDVPRIVILLGAPGAGKGTQAKRLAASRGLTHISTGDLFRENLANETELGKQAKGYMESGQLVPDELVLDMLFDRVSRPDCEDGYVLDGFPRTLPQAEALERRLGADVVPIVPNLEVSVETIVRRASGRLTCRACGNLQHLEFSPPRVAGTCDVCGGELYQRKDDQPDVVRERLHVYEEQTAPLVDFYRTRGVLHSIDGERDADAVFKDVEALVPASGEGVV